MKVKVIQTTCTSFTIGKEYEVLGHSWTDVTVIDDDGEQNSLYMREIEVVKEIENE